MDGNKAKLFWCWCAHRRAALDRIIIHENVPEFGLDDLRLQLSQYAWTRIVVDPSELGWASRRRRQLSIGIVKDLIFPVVQTMTGLQPCEEATRQLMDLERLLPVLFHCKCEFGLNEYLIALESELEEDLEWAGSRPSVKGRMTIEGEGRFMKCLTPAENKTV